MEFIQTRRVIYGLYTNTSVTCEYTGAAYQGTRVINMKCTILFYFYTCAWVMFCTHIHEICVLLQFFEYVWSQLPTQRIYRLLFDFISK